MHCGTDSFRPNPYFIRINPRLWQWPPDHATPATDKSHQGYRSATGDPRSRQRPGREPRAEPGLNVRVPYDPRQPDETPASIALHVL
jgi:hypothetical protein